MNRTKSSVQTSSTKPITLNTPFKFEKVQHLNQLIGEAVEQSEQRSNVGDKVLDLLKTHIKNNYDSLYQNYGDNKKKILKCIQTVETNIAGENAMNSRFDELVKDKSKYDRLHAQVGDKQRKLKKLRDIRNKLASETESAIDSTIQNNDKAASIVGQREALQHQSHVLKQMLSERQKIQICLHQKQLRLGEQLEQKRQRYLRLTKENQKKMEFLATQFEQQQIKVPQKLAEQLALKIEMYENKHSYNSIIGHQAILEEKRFARLKEAVRSEREQQRLNKMKRQFEQRNRLEQLYNIALIKNLEEQKIKKFCCVPEISESINDAEVISEERLKKLREQIQQRIAEYQSENSALEQHISQLISNQNQKCRKGNFYEAEGSLNAVQKQWSSLKQSLKKWQDQTRNWKIIISLLPFTLSNEEQYSDMMEWEEMKKSESSSPTIAENPCKTNRIHDYNIF